MTDLELVTLLDFYGHLRNPFGEARQVSTPVGDLKVTDQVVRDAVQSYQSLHAVVMEPIIAAFYPQRLSAAVKLDGIVGPATTQLLETARCACPDYDPSLPEELVGVGNWKRCHGVGEFHSVLIKFTNKPPAHVAPLMDTIWGRVVDAYADVGLLLTRNDNAINPNIDVSFVQPDGGWIGLAIVGQGQQCGDRIWARFDRNYKPADMLNEWTTLMTHEFGHNCGLSHSSGGIMNPYIVKALKPTWRGDPSYNLLASRFGGQPVPREPKQRKMVLAWQTGINTFEVIQEISTTGGSIWPV